MSSEKFEDLEDELKVLHEDVTGKITHKIPKLSGGRSQIVEATIARFEHFKSKPYNTFSVSELRKSTIREVEKKIEDANLIVSIECKVKLVKSTEMWQMSCCISWNQISISSFCLSFINFIVALFGYVHQLS